MLPCLFCGLFSGDGKDLSKDITNKKEDKKLPKKSDTPIMRYIKTQVHSVLLYIYIYIYIYSKAMQILISCLANYMTCLVCSVLFNLLLCSHSGLLCVR